MFSIPSHDSAVPPTFPRTGERGRGGGTTPHSWGSTVGQCTTLHCTALLYRTVQCTTGQCSIVQCNSVQYSEIQCSALQIIEVYGGSV